MGVPLATVDTRTNFTSSNLYDISSLKLPANSDCCVEGFEDGSYSGKSEVFCKDVNDFSYYAGGWNDRISSVKLIPGKLQQA